MKKEFNFGVEKVEVSFNGVDFIIDPDLPIDTMKKLVSMQKATENDYEKNIDFIASSVKEYLYISNDKAKVDSFIDPLGALITLKIYKAIMSIISESQKTEIEEKKTE